MRRRRATPGSSLDLLLDTVCNAFGGIVFIALLVAVLLQQTGASGGIGDLSGQIEHERLGREARRIEGDIEASRTAANDDAQQIDTEDPVAAASLQRDLDDLRKRNADLCAGVAELAERNRAARRALEAPTERRAREEQDEAETRGKIADLEARLDRLRTEKTRTLRLPTLHISTKKNLWLIVQGGRLYLCLADPDSGLDPAAAHESVHATRTEEGCKFEPRPGRGQDIADGMEKSSWCAEVLRKAPANSYSLHFAVYPDSFEAFVRLRDLFQSKGYSYNWMPLSEAEPLVLVYADKVEDQ